MALSKGSQAPAITLKQKTAEGIEKVTLDYRANEKTVILFFPLAFTGVCTEELCSVSGGINEYEDLNAKVYAISVDSPFAQEAFAKAQKITIPLLSDFNREACSEFDVMYDIFAPGVLDLNGVAKRSAFIIDSEGIVAYRWASDNPKDLPPFEEMKSILKEV